VDTVLTRIGKTSGTGSSLERKQLLSALLAEATPEEQQFLARLLLGELRQGALEGVMVEAIAKATQISRAEVRRALRSCFKITQGSARQGKNRRESTVYME
jgi:DNA ligase-1